MNQSTAGERITAAVSTVVAIVLLGAAVTAEPTPGPPADRIKTLESDLRFQLELAYRTNSPELGRRVAQVDAAVAAWRSSPRGEQDDQALLVWLRTALDESMPGRSGELPAIPEFRPTAPTPSPAATGATEPTIATQTHPVEPAPSRPTARPVDSPTPTPAVPMPPSVRRTTPATQLPTQLPPASTVGATDPSRAPRTVQRPIILAVSPPEPIVAGAPASPSHAAPAELASDAPAAEHSVAVRPPAPAPQSQGSPTLPPAPSAGEVPYTSAVVPSTPVELAGESPTPPTEHAVASEIAARAERPAISVNLRELNARINGYHQELGEIEAATVVEDSVGPRQLNRLVAQLESLAGQYQLVHLYYDALSDAERQRVTSPRAMDEAIDLVNRHIQAADENRDIFAEFDAADAPTNESLLAERLRKVAETVGLSGD
jgi:hypothetical protein